GCATWATGGSRRCSPGRPRRCRRRWMPSAAARPARGWTRCSPVPRSTTNAPTCAVHSPFAATADVPPGAFLHLPRQPGAPVARVRQPPWAWTLQPAASRRRGCGSAPADPIYATNPYASTPDRELAMAQYQIGVVVGSLRRDSFNRKLATALSRLAPAEFSFRDLRIDDLPLYNQDDDANQPEPVKR